MPEIFFADSFIYSSNLQFISAESSNIPFFHSQTTKYIESQLHSTYERIFDDSAEINCKFDE